jgi:hypothetical protein
MRQMAEQGGSAIEIARTIGSTPGSVRVVCCHHKIRLKRGPRAVYHVPHTAACYTQRKADQVIRAQMPKLLFVEFGRKAEQLQLSAPGLASRLLTAIATSNIYEAVLDDD